MVINIWESASGSCRVLNFIDGLPSNARVKVMRVVDHLEEQGLNLLSTSKMKKMSGYDNLYELKIPCNKISVRILFSISNNEATLLEGFLKKDQRTQKRHIVNAIERTQTL